LNDQHNIGAADMELLHLVDTAEDAVAYIEAFYSKFLLSPNF